MSLCLIVQDRGEYIIYHNGKYLENYTVKGNIPDLPKGSVYQGRFKIDKDKKVLEYAMNSMKVHVNGISTIRDLERPMDQKV